MTIPYLEEIKQYNMMLHLIASDTPNQEVAKQFGKTAGYISQLRKKINQMQYPPKFIEDKLVCFRCNTPYDVVSLRSHRLCIHHNHTTGQPISLICHRCNVQIGKGDLTKEIQILNGQMLGMIEIMVKDPQLTGHEFLETTIEAFKLMIKEVPPDVRAKVKALPKFKEWSAIVK